MKIGGYLRMPQTAPRGVKARQSASKRDICLLTLDGQQIPSYLTHGGQKMRKEPQITAFWLGGPLSLSEYPAKAGSIAAKGGMIWEKS
jgi:hypothetical protein